MLLEVKNIKKTYKKLVAVDDVSFSIPRGICFGLLGPNGAGKTTTIEVIEDIITSDEGEILYKGKPRASAFREEIGIQFQHTALLAFLTVRESLETFKRLYSKTADLEQLVQICHLSELKNQFNDKISGGQRQRLLLALAMVNNPTLLFLDEPSTGLDPQARRNLWDVVENIKKQGKTIILTTHYMEEAQVLCDQIAIMDHGRIIAQGSPDQLIRQFCQGVTVILPRKGFHAPLKRLAINFKQDGDRIKIQTQDINSCLKQLIQQNVDLTDLTVHSPNLEDVFLKLTGRQLRA